MACELDAGDVPSAMGTAEAETCGSSEVLVVRGSDSEVFRDCAKTLDVEVGNRMPKEISSEFHRSFMGHFWGLLRGCL